MATETQLCAVHEPQRNTRLVSITEEKFPMAKYPKVEPQIRPDGRPLNDIERVLIILLEIRDLLRGTIKNEEVH